MARDSKPIRGKIAQNTDSNNHRTGLVMHSDINENEIFTGVITIWIGLVEIFWFKRVYYRFINIYLISIR